jgi:hypothetical protein
MTLDAIVFRASLDGFPDVSRDVAVRSDQTLIDLHRILQGPVRFSSGTSAG